VTAQEWVRSLSKPPAVFRALNPAWEPQPQDIDRAIFGDLIGIKDKIVATLRQLGDAAGVPSSFDWWPALEAAAQQHYNQFGGQLYRGTASNYSYPVYAAVQYEAAEFPGLAALLPNLGPGSEFWNQGELQRQRAEQISKRSHRADNIGLASVLIAPVASYFLAPAAAGSSVAAETATVTASEAATWEAVATGWEGAVAESASQNAALAAVAEANVQGTMLTALQVGSKLSGFYSMLVKAKGAERDAQAKQEAQLVARQQAAARPAGSVFSGLMPANGSAIVQGDEDSWLIAGALALLVIVFGVIAGKGLRYV